MKAFTKIVNSDMRKSVRKSEIYRGYKTDRAAIDSILQRGAEKARAIAAPNLNRIREKIGIR